MEASERPGARMVGIAEAKAKLSSMVTAVEQEGDSFVIMRYGRPAALLTPFDQPRETQHRARGSLRAYRDTNTDVNKEALEEGAFLKAMEDKHGRDVA